MSVQVGDVLASHCPTNQLDAVRVDAARPAREGTAAPDRAVEWPSTPSAVVWPTTTPAAPSLVVRARAPLCAIRPKPAAGDIAVALQQAPPRDDAAAAKGHSQAPSSPESLPPPPSPKTPTTTSKTTTTTTSAAAPPLPPARKTVRHTADGRWVSAKDIICDALSLWGTDSMTPARTVRAVRERYPEALERRPVTGGGPQAPVVHVDAIGTFCARLAAIMSPPYALAVLDYPKSERCAEVLALLEVARARLHAQPTPPPLSDDSDGLVRAARDRSRRDAPETCADNMLCASPNDSCPTDEEEASAEGHLPTGESGSAVCEAHSPASRSCGSDTRNDGVSDSDYAEQREGATSNQRTRRRRRRHDHATPPPSLPRRSKRQKRSHRVIDDSQAAASGSECRRAQHATPPPTETLPLRDQAPDSPEPVALLSSTPSAAPAVPFNDMVAAQDAHHVRVVTRLLARATARRPLCVWRWGHQRWRLALEAVPARQGVHWPWQVMYEAPAQGAVVARATPAAGTTWIEWDDIVALARRCLVSPHYMAVVSAARQVPLVDALGACASRDAPPYAIDDDLFNGADDDATADAISADDVASVLDGWVPTACRQWLQTQPRRCPMPLDLARRTEALAAAAAGTPYAARLHRLAAAATAATEAV